MKPLLIFKNSIISYCLVTFLALVLFAGCQKDNLMEISKEGLHAPGIQTSLALEKIILEVNFQMTTEGMSDEQIQEQYSEMMGHLSEEDRNRLIAVAQSALDQEYPYSPGHMVSPRSVESILTTGNINDDFGSGVATVGNKVYVGAKTIQRVYEYSKTGGTYSLINEITPDPATINFGTTLSVSGSWMAVSAPRTAATGGGRVFMYKKQGNEWVQKVILTGPPGNENFGGGVLIGNTLVAHSRAPGVPSSWTSTISVFALNGNEWTLQQELVQPGIYHRVVKLDASENRMATASGLGNAFSLPRSLIYVRDGLTWTLEDEVIINLPDVGASTMVAIDGDNLLLLAAFPGYKHLMLTNNGGDWQLSQELIVPVSLPNASRFAQIEGEKLVIGVGSFSNAVSEAVYVFENFGASWDLTETLIPSDLGVNCSMNSIALEGNTIVAGCWNAGPAFAGKVYIFE